MERITEWTKETLLENYKNVIAKNVKNPAVREKAIVLAADFLKNEMFSVNAFSYKMALNVTQLFHETTGDKELCRLELAFDDHKGFYIKTVQ